MGLWEGEKMLGEQTIRAGLSIIIAVACAGTTEACRRQARQQDDSPTVTIRIEPAHALLSCPARPEVRLGDGTPYDIADSSLILFHQVAPGDYDVHVAGALLVERVTVHVDARGAGEATVKVVPLAAGLPAPWIPPGQPTTHPFANR